MKKLFFYTAIFLCSLVSSNVVYAAALDPEEPNKSVKTGAMKMTPDGKLISYEQLVEIFKTAESLMSEFNLERRQSKDVADVKSAIVADLTVHLFNGHEMPEARKLTVKAFIEFQQQQVKKADAISAYAAERENRSKAKRLMIKKEEEAKESLKLPIKSDIKYVLNKQ